MEALAIWLASVRLRMSAYSRSAAPPRPDVRALMSVGLMASCASCALLALDLRHAWQVSCCNAAFHRLAAAHAGRPSPAASGALSCALVRSGSRGTRCSSALTGALHRPQLSTRLQDFCKAHLYTRGSGGSDWGPCSALTVLRMSDTASGEMLSPSVRRYVMQPSPAGTAV